MSTPANTGECSGPLEGLRLPVIAAPMFINSSRDLVVACAKAGIVGTFPSLNPREPEILADWLDEIEDRCADNPVSAGHYGVNLIVNKTNAQMGAHLKVLGDKKVPMVITSLGAVSEVVDEVHRWGGIVLHDIISRRHAEKAIEAGVDGLILVSAGAGGHGGTLNPFSFLAEIREIFDGTIVLAGGMSSGRAVAAALAAGADFAYLGTRFIASQEAEAEPEYQEMILRASAADIVYTNRVSGVHGNFLRESLDANGVDLTGEAPAYKPGAMRPEDKKKGAWKRIWGGGHGVGTVHAVEPVARIVDQLEAEYREGIADLVAGNREMDA
jgi:nitronate monooxygenase